MPTALRPAIRPKLDLYDWVDQDTPTGLERELDHFYDNVAPPDEEPTEPIGDRLSWALRHRRIDGQPFSLDRFPPLVGPYQDDHPHIVIIKPAQRGCSELAVNYACYALEHGATAWAPEKDGLNVGYVFSTEKSMQDFSKERLTGLQDESEHLRDLFGADTWNAVTFKQVGRSYIYLRGSESEAGLRSFAADVLVLDEYDAMQTRSVALARRRLNASMVRRELDLSTPSLPGRGIHAEWLQSDRRVYEQACPHCGVWHGHDFHRDVRVDGADFKIWQHWDPARIRAGEVYLVCPSCQARLSDADRCAFGRWTAEAPEVTSLRGYWIPWWPFPFVDLLNLAVSAATDNPSELEEFYRSDLGIPYVTSGGRVTPQILDQLDDGLPNGKLPDVAWRATTMGVDVGSRFHYRISSLAPEDAPRPGAWDDLSDQMPGRMPRPKPRPYVRAMGSVGSWAELDALWERYRVRFCVVDSLPEIHGARAFADLHRGKVLLATYPSPNAMAGQVYRTAASDETQTRREARRRAGGDGKAIRDDLLQINRTAAMDELLATLAGGREHWPSAIVEDPEVRAHMTAPNRVVGLDARGQERAEWVHSGPDHGFHASVYDRAARAHLPKESGLGVLVQASAKGW